MAAELLLSDAPDKAAMAVILKGLSQYNAETAGYWDRQPLAVLVSDPDTSNVIGGLYGRTSLGLLFIDAFYLPASLRGEGIGSRVLSMAEAEAERRGCCAAVLETIDFQAPGFYERHGYRVFGRIPCDPPGTARIFMHKALREARQISTSDAARISN